MFVKWLHAANNAQLLQVGVMWVLLTVGFEIVLGRCVFGYSWSRIAADYNLLQGGLMSIGLVVMVFSPLIAAKVRSQDFSPFNLYTNSRQ
jgi:hypothetical protein